MSPSTGIILNNEMDDFAYPGFGGNGLPPSENNFAKPGKRPVSSMVPTIVVDKSSGDVRLVIGGVGGSVITTSVASVSGQDIFRTVGYPELLDIAISGGSRLNGFRNSIF